MDDHVPNKYVRLAMVWGQYAVGWLVVEHVPEYICLVYHGRRTPCDWSGHMIGITSDDDRMLTVGTKVPQLYPSSYVKVERYV